MKFLVSTASCTIPPCEGAVLEPTLDVDVRCTSDPGTICGGGDAAREKWYSEGTNHRLGDDGCIRRDFIRDQWVFEADSIEQFVKDHGSCVVSLNSNGMLSLKIYDDYLE